MVLSLVEAITGSDGPTPVEPVLFLVLTGLAMASLAWRRRAPLLVAVIVVSVNLVVNPTNEFSTLLSLVLVSYTVGSETRPPLSYVGLALIVVPFVGVSVRQGIVASDVAAALVFFVGPWTVGWLVSSRAARTEAAVARAEQLERDREAEAQRAAAEERTRIARELHDIVSHSISVITIQTQAVRRRLRPDQVDEAGDLAAVEATAREAMAEMRRMFGVLRGAGGGAGPGARSPAWPSWNALSLRRLVGCRGAADGDRGAGAALAGAGPRGVPDRSGGPDQRAPPLRCAAGRPRVRYRAGAVEIDVPTTAAGSATGRRRRSRPSRHPGAGRPVRRHGRPGRRARRRGSPRLPAEPAGDRGVRMISVGDRRRPGHGPCRLPLAAVRRARSRGGRRGGQRRGRRRGW